MISMAATIEELPGEISDRARSYSFSFVIR